MKFDEIVDLSLSFWLNDMAKATTICLLGPPGIGKSAVGKTLAARMTVAARGKGASESAVCEVVDLSSRAPEDISGLPFKGNELGFGSVTDYAPQRWLARLCQDGVYGVLILDDLPAASPAVQVATRQLALDRRVGDKHLSPNVILIVTGNRREDKSAATTLPAHFRNSVMMLDLQVDLDEWCAWYGGQEGHAPVIASFLRRRPALLSGLPSNSDSRGAFPTPRAWTKLGSVYDIAERRRVVLPVAEARGIPLHDVCRFLDAHFDLVQQPGGEPPGHGRCIAPLHPDQHQQSGADGGYSCPGYLDTRPFNPL